MSDGEVDSKRRARRSQRWTPGRLLLSMATAIFASEMLVMMTFERLGITPSLWANLLDAALLVAVAFPILYYLIFRSMLRDLGLLHDWAEFYRTVYGRSPYGVILYDAKTRLPVEFNDVACAQLGYSREEFAALRLTDHEIPPASGPPRTEAIMRAGHGEIKADFRTKTGEARIVQVTTWTVPVSDLPLLHCIVRDVTETERAEERAREFASVIDTSWEAVVITGRDGIIRSVNPSWERLSGWSREDVVGKVTPRVLKSGKNDPAVYEALWRTITDGDVFRGELLNRRKDGGLYTVETIIMPLKGADGQDAGFCGIERDVTERRRSEESLKNTEEQLRQSQKMEAFGRLAGGVAHDFNNILSAILGYASLLGEGLRGDDKRLADLDEINQAALRAAALTKQLLAFSRRQVMVPQVLDLNAVVEQTEKMLRRLIGENIDLQVKLAEKPGQIKADYSQVGQVLLNLAINARDAMPEHGRLTIETANVEMESDSLSRHDAIPAGSYVVLMVSDTGCGMAAETQAHIFEPFFTTKEQGKGTGLGLSTVFGIVKQSGGYIWVYSEPGQGSVFKIYFPRTQEPALPAPPSANGAAPRRGTETILVVEDEEILRHLLVRVLKGNGYTVLEAGDGAQALSVCDRHAGQIHLVMTDVVMPEMGGGQLGQELTRRRPGIKVIYMSGYTDDAILRRGMMTPGTRFLQKPLTMDAVLKEVSEALAEDATLR